MFDRVGELMAAFGPSDPSSVPGWAVAAAVSVLVLIYVLASFRGDRAGGSDAIARIAVVLALGLTGWWMLDRWVRHDLAAEQRALDGRAFELATRAVEPGSALACLDGIAGELVEQSCERALFASPEATAAAVSYVAAQLSLLAAGQMQRGAPGPTVTNLRRAVEADRFGIVAHVLATRQGCTPDQCAAFFLVQDASRISANLAERAFDARVKSAMATWPAAGTRPPPAGAPSATADPAPVASARTPNNLYFPSSSSIPPVNIMTAEPAGSPSAPRGTTGSAEPSTPLPPRKPTQGAAQGRPGTAPARAAPAAPTPPAPQAPSAQ